MAARRRGANTALAFLCLLAVGAGRALAQAPAPAPDVEPDRFTILEENDSLYFNTDKHYTQGLRLSNLFGASPPAGGFWDGPFNALSFGPFFEPGGTRKIAILAGQSLFTPKNLTVRPPDSGDRPYAGWLYGGVSLLQDNAFNQTGGRMLENFEIDFGLVGPGALGKQTQNDFHQFIGIDEAKGWSSQLQHEFGGMVSYERLWRFPLIGDNGFGVDIVPQLGATAGNVFTYGSVGGMLRIGKGLQADYGPVRVRPALSGTDYFDASGLDNGTGWYFFAGMQGRAVGRNIFLDGNTFRTSRSVSKKDFVGDVEAGFSLNWSKSLRVDFSVMERSEEFHGQRSPDTLGTAALTFSW